MIGQWGLLLDNIIGNNINKSILNTKRAQIFTVNSICFFFNYNPKETDLIPCLLLIGVQRVMIHHVGRMKELIISISVAGTVPTICTDTAHFFCREAKEKAVLHKCIL